MADDGTDEADLSGVTYDVDISGKDFWTKLRIYAVADPTFAAQLFATSTAVAAIMKVADVPTAKQTTTSQGKNARLKALSSIPSAERYL